MHILIILSKIRSISIYRSEMVRYLPDSAPVSGNLPLESPPWKIKWIVQWVQVHGTLG